MKPGISRLLGALLASCALALTGCVSLAAVETVKNPPTDYQKDVVVDVEFLRPSMVGQHCAARGVSVFGMAAPGAMACASPSRMTVPNACDMVTGGWYADAACAAIAHANGWAPEIRAPEIGAPEIGAPRDLLMLASWSPGEDGLLRPEGDYRAATAVRVEFVDAGRVGLRCAERGALDGGRMTTASLACASASGITLVNPCSVVEGGWYGALLCHELAHVNGWPASHPGRGLPKGAGRPAGHTPLSDQARFATRLSLAHETGIASRHQAGTVYAVTPARLAASPALARQIAEKAGTAFMPYFPLPRMADVPDLWRAGFGLPLQVAGLITGKSPGEPHPRLRGRARVLLVAEAAEPAPARPPAPEAGTALVPAGASAAGTIPPGLRLRGFSGRDRPGG